MTTEQYSGSMRLISEIAEKEKYIFEAVIG